MSGMEQIKALPAKWQQQGPEIGPSVGHLARAECARQLTTALQALRDEAGEAVWMFKDDDGKWRNFLNDKHREDTIADGRWEVRAFYPCPAPAAPVSDEAGEADWADAESDFATALSAADLRPLEALAAMAAITPAIRALADRARPAPAAEAP